MIAVFISGCYGGQTEESFIVKKKKPQQSINKIKEQYADELAELIRMIPGMQRQLADLQESLIDELYGLLENDMHLSKVELDSHVKKARELRSYLAQECTTLDAKKSFVSKANDKVK